MATAAGRCALGLLIGVVGSLLLWATVPALFGYRANLVVSDSMRPSIARGDVVLTRPVDASKVHPGQVVLIDDPARATPVLHRVRSVDGGVVVTQGDANATPDTAPVDVARIVGEGRILVPRIGLPVLWARSSGSSAAITAAVLAVAVGALAAGASRRRAAPAGAPAAPSPSTAPCMTAVPLPLAGMSPQTLVMTGSVEETELVGRRLDEAARCRRIIDLTVRPAEDGAPGGACFSFRWTAASENRSPERHRSLDGAGR